MNESKNEFPDQLDADFEEQLRRIEIPDASLDSAQLMYQAGWAAAMASLGDLPQTHRENLDRFKQGAAVRGNSIWRWATVVSIATSILLGGLYVFQLRTPVVQSTAGRVEQDPVAENLEPAPKVDAVREHVERRRSAEMSLERVVEDWPAGVPMNLQALRGGPQVPVVPVSAQWPSTPSTEEVESLEESDVLRSGPSMRLLKELGLLGSIR